MKLKACGLPSGKVCFSTMIWPNCVLWKRTVIVSPGSRSIVAVLPVQLLLSLPSLVTNTTLLSDQPDGTSSLTV